MVEAGRAVLLDANLLLLAVVGSFDKRLIGRRRLDVFSPSDFELLAGSIAGFGRNLTTPHILTETSDLAGQCVPKQRLREFREFFAGRMKALDERWMKASELCQADSFRQLGLADAAICQLVDEQTWVLSTDAALCAALWGAGANARNFNHLRDL